MVRAEKAIALDFLLLRARIAATEHDPVAKENFWAALSLPAYEHYWTKNREIFYDGFEIHTLSWQCNVIMRLKRNVAEKTMTIADAEKALLQIMKDKTHPPIKESFWQRILRRLIR